MIEKEHPSIECKDSLQDVEVDKNNIEDKNL